MDIDDLDDSFTAHRLESRRWAARVASTLVSSRALSSSIFVFLVVATDHGVSVADDMITSRLKGRYDPLVLATIENVYMIIALGIAVGALSAATTTRRVSEWLTFTVAGSIGALGVILGVQGTLWAFSRSLVSGASFEGSAVIQVPLVLAVQFGVFEGYYVFHLAGALYSCVGLLAEFFGSGAVKLQGKYGLLAVGNHAVWALFLLGLARFFACNKRIPVAPLALGVAVARLLVVGSVSLVLANLGHIHSDVLGCLTAGRGCDRIMPVVIASHAFALALRLLSFVIVVKYIGAPICAVTGVTSNCLRFYAHSSLTLLDLSAAVTSLVGCAVFTHGQWLHEVSSNEAWDAAMRRTTIAALFSSDEDAIEDGIDDMEISSEHVRLLHR